ncbi:hypothetical protein Csa_000211 [Cucumis sativus]|nr:hypothetical protein Csa_000211 [Cucumis sativus]
MGFFFLFILTISSLTSSMAFHNLQSPHLLDLYIRDYTLKSLDNTVKTGTLHSVPLPENFSGIDVATARFRCGSLRRYGASVKEFHVGVGVSLNPCAERIVIIRQNLGSNWSSIYFNNYRLTGYQLVSSILGILAYNSGNNGSSSSPVPFEVGISAGEKPITIDFRNSTRMGKNSRTSYIGEGDFAVDLLCSETGAFWVSGGGARAGGVEEEGTALEGGYRKRDRGGDRSVSFGVVVGGDVCESEEENENGGAGNQGL